jgi:hypothetical protein
VQKAAAAPGAGVRRLLAVLVLFELRRRIYSAKEEK